MRRVRCFVHFTWVLLLGLPTLAAAQAQGASPVGTPYAVFLGGKPIGEELISVTRGQDGATVTAQGRLLAPLNITTRSAELRYRSDWTPTSFRLDAIINQAALQLRTSFAEGKATTEGTSAGQPVSVSHDVVPRTLILANGIFASYVPLAHRLMEDSEVGAEFRVYVVPQAEVTVAVKAIRPERIQIGTAFLDVRQFELAFDNAGGALAMTLWAAPDGGLVRLTVPAQALDVVRKDVASPTSRTQLYSNPSDEPVIIPASGFNLGATLTRPAGVAAGSKAPAVILLAGTGVGDRDGVLHGVPILTQLAGAVADSGMFAVRYDKRGNGQSGGRSESATIADFAEDVRTVTRWLEKRPDVDPRRIAVIGHSDGAWVALLAAARERRITAVVSLAGPSTTGAERMVEQQRLTLEQSSLTPEEQQKRIALQQQIHAAVLTGKGWDSLPPELRRDADTPWFHSVLTFDPAKVLEDVRQPILLVHGALDKQVPVEHVEKLAQLAQRKESKSKSVEVVVVRGVNHLLVPAITGEVSEYGTLPDRSVSKDVITATTDWLKRTLAAIR